MCPINEVLHLFFAFQDILRGQFSFISWISSLVLLDPTISAVGHSNVERSGVTAHDVNEISCSLIRYIALSS